MVEGPQPLHRDAIFHSFRDLLSPVMAEIVSLRAQCWMTMTPLPVGGERNADRDDDEQDSCLRCKMAQRRRLCKKLMFAGRRRPLLMPINSAYQFWWARPERCSPRDENGE